MGRRKIEIVPITHERNRSVTFLKRKNGLFKKAFELGVLCSVDVAVIIFEERPGHDPKVHQYSSGDIHSIVQRQIQFRGDKDHKGPGDFSGNGPQFDNADNDAVVDEDEDEPISHPPPRLSKRKAGKMNTTPEMASNDDEYVPPGGHRTRSAPRMSAASVHPHSRGASARFDDGPSGSLLPISNDRVSSLRDSGHSISYGGHTRSHGQSASKRPRGPLDSMDPGRRSRSPQDSLISTRGGGGDLYLPDASGGPAQRFGAVTSNARGAYGGPGGPGAGSYGAPHYQPMFPVPGHGQSPPTPSFIAVQGSGGLPFASSNARDAYDDGAGRGRGGFGDGPYDYPGMISRGPGPYGQQQQQHHQPPRGDMFTAFLEADERSRQQGTRDGGRPGNGLEWPTHEGPPVGRERGMMEGAPPMNLQPQPGAPAQDTWFDIFSNSNAASAQGGGPPSGGNAALSMPPPPTTRVPSRAGNGSSAGGSAQQPQSWERSSLPSSTAGPSSMDDLATIFGTENVPVGAAHAQEGARGGAGVGGALAPPQNQHSVVDIPAAQSQQAQDKPTQVKAEVSVSGDATKGAIANGDATMHPADEIVAGGAPQSEQGPALASTTVVTTADAEMHDADRDGDGDADADADADADGEVSAEVDMDKESNAGGK